MNAAAYAIAIISSEGSKKTHQEPSEGTQDFIEEADLGPVDEPLHELGGEYPYIFGLNPAQELLGVNHFEFDGEAVVEPTKKIDEPQEEVQRSSESVSIAGIFF